LAGDLSLAYKLVDWFQFGISSVTIIPFIGSGKSAISLDSIESPVVIHLFGKFMFDINKEQKKKD